MKGKGKGTEGGWRLHLPLPDRVQTSVPPANMFLAVSANYAQENFISPADKRNCLTTRREILN
jgi:hypothetical protein